MSPHERRSRFRRELRRLSARDLAHFERAARQLEEGLRQGFVDPRLRFKRVQGHPGVWEISFAKDRRATLRIERTGTSVTIRWRRVGDHEIFDNP